MGSWIIVPYLERADQSCLNNHAIEEYPNEQLFVFADKIEARYTKSKALLDKLPQSILAKAFRGELVPQDANDEPASFLLERIKEEKAKLAAIKKGKYTIKEQSLNIAAEKKVKYKITFLCPCKFIQ